MKIQYFLRNTIHQKCFSTTDKAQYRIFYSTTHDVVYHSQDLLEKKKPKHFKSKVYTGLLSSDKNGGLNYDKWHIVW